MLFALIDLDLVLGSSMAMCALQLALIAVCACGCAPPPPPLRLTCAQQFRHEYATLFVPFLNPPSALFVHGACLQTAYGNKTYTPFMFSEAQAEIFRLMDKDSFSRRFLPPLRKRIGACMA